jgi:hypothetical protein
VSSEDDNVPREYSFSGFPSRFFYETKHAQGVKTARAPDLPRSGCLWFIYWHYASSIKRYNKPEKNVSQTL